MISEIAIAAGLLVLLLNRMQHEIWKAAIDGVAAKPDAMLVVLNPVNDLIDLHATRIAAGRKHLPMPVMVLLIGCSLLD